MATQQDRQTSIYLTFKVLHFISQLRRRVEPRVQRGSFDASALGTNVSTRQTVARRVTRGLPRAVVHDAKQAQYAASRICKKRQNNRKVLRPWFAPRAPRTGAPASSNKPGEEVQQMLSSADSRLSPSGSRLSEIAGNDELFLKQSTRPTFDGCSLHQVVRLLATAQEAVTTLSDCRLQYGDDWLLAQGQLNGLILDEKFIANYEHLLLQLEAELVRVLVHKALEKVFEEPLHERHNKKQQKQLSWFTEFAEKPRPLGSSFPWTIKPSLAVLWGVCWMFYNGHGYDRVPKERVLGQVDFAWTAPGSSEYVNFGLELLGMGLQPTAPAGAVGGHGHGEGSGNSTSTSNSNSNNSSHAGLAAVGLNGNVPDARNADTWASDLQHAATGASRLPDPAEDYARAIGQAAHDAPPQLPGQSTYDQPVHAHLAAYPHDNYHYAYSSYNTHLPHSALHPSPLTAFAQLSHTDIDHSSWHLPSSSSPHHCPRHLATASQTPEIRVTGPADSHAFAQPQAHAWDLYLDPLAAPGPSPSAPNTPTLYHHFNPTSQTMADTLPPPPQMPPMTIQVPPMKIKHERSSSINSNSNIPTPISMAGGQRSPSPSLQQRHIQSRPQSPTHCSRRSSEDASSHEGDDHLGSLPRNHTYKRSGEPPRNHEAKMVCEHRECADLTFDRKCEWSKHMDKHDRPYKCLVAGCEKLQGFTYSGGLLRHEREVHKMHGGTKKSLFCPFNDCKRSSGAGFTRKENLAEHVRRVHRRTSMSADMHGLIIRRESIMERSPTAESRPASESPYVQIVDYRESSEPAQKRKFSIFSDRGSDRGEDDLRAEIKRLRFENEEKDSRLRQLEQAVMALQQNHMRLPAIQDSTRNSIA